MSTLSYNSPGQVKRGVSFNLQRSLFTYASEDGVEVFHCSPFQASYSTLMSKETNIAVAAVYDDTNILALVGNPLLNKQRDGNTVYFFDGKQQEVVGAVQPGEMVLKVVIAHDRVFVATVHRLFVYKFEDLSLINDVPIEGSTGAFDISNHSKHAEATVIYAGSDHRVCLAGLDLDRDSVYNPPTGNPKDVITKVAITADGTKFAVARADGFNVEVYYLDKKDCGSYLRRGQAAKKINSISFNKSGEKLCCVSAGDKEGTIHVFEVPQNPLTKEPAGGLFSSMKSMVWGGGLPSVNSVGKVCVKSHERASRSL